MNANDLNFNLNALAAPKTIEDLIALGREMCDELDRINMYLDAIFEDATCDA